MHGKQNIKKRHVFQHDFLIHKVVEGNGGKALPI